MQRRKRRMAVSQVLYKVSGPVYSGLEGGETLMGGGKNERKGKENGEMKNGEKGKEARALRSTITFKFGVAHKQQKRQKLKETSKRE